MHEQRPDRGQQIGEAELRIDVHGITSSKLSLQSVSGDARLTFNSGDVEVNTVSGGLMLSGRLDGKVSVETVSGLRRCRVAHELNWSLLQNKKAASSIQPFFIEAERMRRVAAYRSCW